ncbi:CD1845 family protein [Thomasclavelia ramosa]|uniref:CD1845 family protein n=1 Tax=Thomasclavelia ramosa TaxID=1547 RepID=UPI003DA2AA09
MKWVLQIILFPIILLLSILIAFLKVIIKVSGMILGILSFLVFIGAVACFIQKDTTTGIEALIVAFLISPYGLPKIALWITAYLEVARDILKEI